MLAKKSNRFWLGRIWNCYSFHQDDFDLKGLKIYVEEDTLNKNPSSWFTCDICYWQHCSHLKCDDLTFSKVLSTLMVQWAGEWFFISMSGVALGHIAVCCSNISYQLPIILEPQGVAVLCTSHVCSYSHSPERLGRRRENQNENNISYIMYK